MKWKSWWMLALVCGVAGLNAAEDAGDLFPGQPFPVYASTLTDTTGPVFGLSDRLTQEVRVDLQTRGGTRYQTDVVVRGGIFEGAGVQLGGLALFDPQTGHYFSEVPLEPAFLGGAELLTGAVNATAGFNATAGSINWTWAPITPGGSAFLKTGTNAWWGGGVLESARSGEVSYQLAVSGEQGDGSVAKGDFAMWRLSGRLEMAAGGGKLRIFGGHQEKFYGWPGMYTGRALNETEDYAVSLVGFQWESQEAGSVHRLGGYWRGLIDDYEFRRETPNAFFEHKTQVFSLQGDGRVSWQERTIAYRWVFVQDEILRSTSLVNGNFDRRAYGKGSLLVDQPLSIGVIEAAFFGGISADVTSEDGGSLLPVAGMRLRGDYADIQWDGYVEYSATSRVPGYTVLNSGPSGLFGGNPDLGREYAHALEAGASVQSGAWLLRGVLFQREDDDLVDWVYNSATANARQAQPVDLTVQGLELWLRWSSGSYHFEAGYAYLDKSADYGMANADASFYALNYARNRFIVSQTIDFNEQAALRLEVEYRHHPENLLRVEGDEVLRLNAEVALRDVGVEGLLAVLRVDNLTNTAFESLPGTPGPGREVSLTLGYAW